MRISLNRILKTLILFCLTVVFISNFTTVFTFKNLFADGAYWLFDIINLKHFHFEYPHIRLTTLLLQAPSVLLSKYSEDVSLIIWIFCFTYFIYPFLFFGLGKISILKNHTSDLLYWFIGIFIICIIPNWSFAVGIVNESIIISMILFSYIVFKKSPNSLMLCLLSVLIFFGYELGIIFYLTSLYFLYRENKLNLKTATPFIIAFCLHLSVLFLKVLPEDGHVNYLQSIENGIKSWRLISALVFILAIILSDLKNRFLKLIPFVLIFLLYITYFYKLPWTSYINLSWSPFLDRIWAIPVSAIIQIVIYEIYRKNNYTIKNISLLTILLFLIPNIVSECIFNYQQINYSKNLDNFLENKIGCYVLTEEDIAKLRNSSFSPFDTDWDFPHLSVLQQKSITPNAILFLKTGNSLGSSLENEYCKMHERNSLTVLLNNSKILINMNKNFNFDKIIQKIEQSN